jgi:O-antigen ligase
MLDVFYLGFGFSISNIEQTGVLAIFIVLLTWWRKERIQKPRIMETMLFGAFNIALLGWLLYSFGHLIYNTLDPYNPSEFALKNFLKTVVQFSGPLLLVFYFMHRPTGIVVNRRLSVHLIAIGLFALGVNLMIRLWELKEGSLDPANQIEGETPYFAIASLDIMANYYALRNAGPFLGVVCIAFLRGPWFTCQSFFVRGAVWSLYILSLIGSTLSGGRATIVFLFFLSVVVLWLRRFHRLVLSMFAGGLVFVVALNLIPNVLEPMPLIMQRSLQLIVFTSESYDAKASIDSSTSWRKEIVERAFELWRFDSRVFWFGRGTYKFGAEDFRALKRDAGAGAMDVSLRRGATHSLVTDLLLVFGLVGFIIYMTMFACLLAILWRLWKDPRSDDIVKPIALASFILTAFNLAYGIVGGATFPLPLAWLLVCLFAYLYRVEANSLGPPALGQFSPVRGQQRRVSGARRQWTVQRPVGLRRPVGP